ncbi:MAG: type II secretion system protein M [Phycisphaerales bacterium]|nr:MAG: type II secretion system protein M [Phycisphaerales bacterium]
MIRLTKREKLLALSLAGFAAVLSVYVFAVRPAAERLDTLGRLIPRKSDDLRKLNAKSREYAFLRESFEQFHSKVASQQEDFRLLPYIESLIRQSGIERNLASMEQQELPLESDYIETVVQLRLENLTLRKLIDFLSTVQSSEALARIKSLHIRTSSGNGDLLESAVEIHGARLIERRAARM